MFALRGFRPATSRSTRNHQEKDVNSANIHGADTGVRTGLSVLDWIALVLLIIGGLNWGLVGLFSFDLVAAIFGEMSVLSRIIYVLVGLAALYTIYLVSRLRGPRGF